jgi:hypothetical protein
MVEEQLPLFPLNTVLFPGAPLTLHIFEERYRLMIGRCLDDENPFGVVFIRRGAEIGDAANPHEYGTLARINASVRLEDGRFLIATIGEQRFRIQHIVQHQPYIVASVNLLPEEDKLTITTMAEELQATYYRYWQAIATATGSRNQGEQLPDDAVSMAYHLAHRMQVTNERKQRWLETDVNTRIREIITMLRAEMSLLPRPRDRDLPDKTNWSWSWN